jgi:hypothetical protein
VLQEARKWAGGREKNEYLDYSEKSDGVRGASDGDSGAESINMQQKSLVDMQEAVDSDDSEEVCTLPILKSLCLFNSTLTPKGKNRIRFGSNLPLVTCCGTIRQCSLLCLHFNPLIPCRRQRFTCAVARGPSSVSFACVAWTLCCCQVMQN